MAPIPTTRSMAMERLMPHSLGRIWRALTEDR